VVCGIGIEGSQEIEIGRPSAGETGEEETGGSDRKVVEVLHVMGVRPRATISEEGVEELRRFAEAASILECEPGGVLGYPLRDWQRAAMTSKLKIG
jgi:hypothetical protein